MELGVVPHLQPSPDIGAFLRQIRGDEVLPRPPLVEYIVDPVVMRPVVEDVLGREWADYGPDRAQQARYWDNFIAFWLHMGYDFVRLETGLAFPRPALVGDDPTMASGQRGWWDEHHGAIATWEDFERYPWPRVEDVDLWPLEYICEHLPDGMGFITCHGGGPYEHLSATLSYEGLSYLLHDDRELVRTVADRIGELLLEYYRQLVQLDGLAALFQGDDMGFRSGTLISPDDLRELTLPWHKRFADLAHENGVPYLLHSCGEVSAIMDTLCEDVGIDGKHSFEDAIWPVTEFHAQYGHRIAALGGVDVDVLARGTSEQVRARVREILDACAPRGRFALGSGNSIPSYVPVANYLAMIDEALAYEL